MKEYHKIQTVFHRSPESNYKQLMEGVFALPEFELLKDIEWTWTEKIDGTNIRILWDGQTVRFGSVQAQVIQIYQVMKVYGKKKKVIS